MRSIRLVVTAGSLFALFALGCSSSTTPSSTTNSSTCGALNSPSNPEDKACEDCMAASCNAELSACYGSGYKTGNFSGPCGPVATCTCSCPEGDLSCLTGCAEKGGTTCEDCVAKIDACETAKCGAACGRTGE